MACAAALLALFPAGFLFSQDQQASVDAKHRHGYVVLTGGKGGGERGGGSKNWDNVGVEAGIILLPRAQSKFLNSRFLLGAGAWTSYTRSSQEAIARIMSLDENKQKGVLRLISSNHPNSPELGEGGWAGVAGIRIVSGLFAIGKIGRSTESVIIESTSWEWQITDAGGRVSYAPYYSTVTEWKHPDHSVGLRYLTNRGLSLALGIEYSSRSGVVGSIGIGF